MLWVISKFMKVRITAEEEEKGLDETLHGETAYI
jgi:ammonia channel protein AmtB